MANASPPTQQLDMRAITAMPRFIFEFSEKLFIRRSGFFESWEWGGGRVVRACDHDDFATEDGGGLVAGHHQRRNKYPSAATDRDTDRPHIVDAREEGHLSGLKGGATGTERITE